MDAERLGRGLLDGFARVPDPRSPHGRRHPLPAVLALATAAMLSGARSLYAIAQWGRLQPPAVVAALGFTRERTPAVSTLHLVFRALDAAAFEAAPAGWARASLGAEEAIAVDGKGLRGIHGEELPGVRLVAGYCDGAGLVLAQSGGRGRWARGGAGRGPRPARGAAAAGAAGDRRRAVLPARLVPAGRAGEGGLPRRRQGQPAGPAMGGRHALRRAAARRALRHGGRV